MPPYLFFLFFPLTLGSDEALMLSAAQKVFATTDGSFLLSLNSDSMARLHSQVRRLLAVDPSYDWNITTVRELTDDRLMQVLLLALVGNYTSAGSATWEQPCKVVMNPADGRLEVKDLSNSTDQILRVLLFALIGLLLKRLLEDENPKGK